MSFERDQLEYNIKQEKLYFGVFAWNITPNRIGTINISETEEVYIMEKIFRADKAITYLRTNKVLSTTEDKTANWKSYQDELIEYRDYVFEKYPAVKEYCELHCVKDELKNIDKIKDIILKDVVKNIELKNSQGAYMAFASSAFCLGRDGIKLFPKNQEV